MAIRVGRVDGNAFQPIWCASMHMHDFGTVWTHRRRGAVLDDRYGARRRTETWLKTAVVAQRTDGIGWVLEWLDTPSICPMLR